MKRQIWRTLRKQRRYANSHDEKYTNLPLPLTLPSICILGITKWTCSVPIEGIVLSFWKTSLMCNRKNFVMFHYAWHLDCKQTGMHKSSLVIFSPETPDSVSLLNTSFSTCVRTERSLEVRNPCTNACTLTQTGRSETLREYFLPTVLGCILLFVLSSSGKSTETANCKQPVALEDINQCNQSYMLSGFCQDLKGHNTGQVLW